MEPALVRIGWMKMLLKLYRKTGGEALYGELIRILERLIAAAEREVAAERAAVAERKAAEETRRVR